MACRRAACHRTQKRLQIFHNLNHANRERFYSTQQVQHDDASALGSGTLSTVSAEREGRGEGDSCSWVQYEAIEPTVRAPWKCTGPAQCFMSLYSVTEHQPGLVVTCWHKPLCYTQWKTKIAIQIILVIAILWHEYTQPCPVIKLIYASLTENH